YEKRILQFKRIRKRIKKNGTYDKADMLIKEYYDYYLNRAETAVKMLEESDYMALSDEARNKKTFCHNSFKGDNIKTDSKTGMMYVDNFGKAAYDVCVTDLAYYIRQIIKKEGTEKGHIRDVIDAYKDETEFDEMQKKLNCAMIVFPWKFMNLCNEYHNKRKAFTFDASVQRLERCVKSVEKEEEIINMLM
ncbi:MAG: hypothetical protein IKU80_02920, partial [Firmicutes bacterium]|nr:hypothetical protein [Bacillota bacterium]